MREGPGRGKGTSPPPVADEGLVPFPQRSKNARKSVSPQHFSGTARWTENEISPPCRICHSRACFATARQHPRVPSLAAVRQFTLWRGCGNCGLASPATGSARPQFPSLVSFSLVPFFWTSKRKVHPLRAAEILRLALRARSGCQETERSGDRSLREEDGGWASKSFQQKRSLKPSASRIFFGSKLTAASPDTPRCGAPCRAERHPRRKWRCRTRPPDS